MGVWRRRPRGVIILTALFVVVLVMGWVIASTARVHRQLGFVRQSDRKAQAYYQAKTGANRALARLQQDANWLSEHPARDSADQVLVEGARCWVESVAGQPDSFLVKAEATVDSVTETVTVAVTRSGDRDTRFFSVAPSQGNGPDVITWSTERSEAWDALPPIPGEDRINEVTALSSGDVFALTGSGGAQSLWRYREGRGWTQMPAPPQGVTISKLASSGEAGLIAIGSDNTLVSLQLEPSVAWTTQSPPSGTITSLASAPDGGSGFAVVDTGAGPAIYQFDLASKQWTGVPLPEAALYDGESGALIGGGGPVTDLSGGITVGAKGEIFVASNTPGAASAVYQYTPGEDGSAGRWTAKPPIPKISWSAGDRTSMDANSGYVDQIASIKADDQGKVWLEWDRPDATNEVLVFSADNQASVSMTAPGDTSTSGIVTSRSQALVSSTSVENAPVVKKMAKAAVVAPKSSNITLKSANVKVAKAAVVTNRSATPTISTVTSGTDSPNTKLTPVAPPPTYDPGASRSSAQPEGEFVPETASAKRPDETTDASGPETFSSDPSIGVTPDVPEPGSSSIYGIFSARPDFAFDATRQQFTRQSSLSQADQRAMGLGPGQSSGLTRFVPVAER